MYSAVTSAVVTGVEARCVQVEAAVSDGMPVFTMVGYLAGEVREAQDRVRTALRSSGEALPVKRITVNLAPANLRKEGTGFDLAIACALLLSAGQLPAGCTDGYLLTGELGLNGMLRPVRGVLQMVDAARQSGFHSCIVPEENLREGALIRGIRVLGASSLQEVLTFYREGRSLREGHTDIEEIRRIQKQKSRIDFSQLKGQAVLRRCAEITVAGFHNMLMIGPPGSGKSMAAKCISSILPDPSEKEILEMSKIHSIAGTLPEEGIQAVRPFRSPHHTVSPTALAGGGRSPRPGEISLSHGGVLFLDELTEFHATSLEILRQPMEDGKIVVSRLGGIYTYPTRFMLVAACNPCKCGYYPDRSRCHCSARDVKNYMERISQPLLDRMDICTSVKEPSYKELLKEDSESSASIRKRIEAAQQLQAERYRKSEFRFNADLSLRAAQEYCLTGRKEKQVLEKLYENMHLTGRTCLKILRVARTIADLEGSEAVTAQHLYEAASYRMPDGGYWGEI